MLSQLKKYFLILILILNTSLFSEEDSIEILLSSNYSIYLSTLQSIQSTAKKKLNLNFTNSMNDSQMKDFFSALEKRKVPFLITLGPQASLLAKENLNTTPILYSLINLIHHIQIHKFYPI